MLILPEPVLRQLATQLITAARSCTDHNGDIPVIKTVEESTMRSTVKAALALLTGHAVDTEVPQFKDRHGR